MSEAKVCPLSTLWASTISEEPMGSADETQPVHCVDAGQCPFAESMRANVQAVLDLTQSVRILTEKIVTLQIEVARLTALQGRRDVEDERAATTIRWAVGLLVSVSMVGAGYIMAHLIGK